MKKILLFIVVGITLLAIPVSIFLVSKNTELRKRAAPATTLSLTPANTTVKVGDVFTVETQIDTGDNQVIAAELHIVFDPEKLEAQSITNGTLAPNVLTSGVIESGTASITVAAASQAAPIKGRGTIAVLRMKARSASPSPISIRFASNTFLGALGEGTKNVLIGSTPSTITILNADGTKALADTNPTLTANPTATPSATPTLILTQPPQSTTSGQASPSALLITSPTNNASITNELPTIRGKATPGSTVTLTIYSDPLNAIVTADANGNWSYTPTIPLAAGPHAVVALVADAAGGTQTTTTNFVVAAEESLTESSESAIPISGTTENTILLLGIGVLLLLSGALLPIFVQ